MALTSARLALPSARRTSARRVAPAKALPAASAADAPVSEAVKLASSIGLDGAEEGLFGFRPFPELWTGRLAMCGFAMGAGGEIVTGTTTLRQLGLETPNGDLATLLYVVLGGATLVATARTLIRLQNGDMTMREFQRYADYFGLSAEKTAAIESAQRKRAGDFTSADRLAAVADAKSEGTLADDLLQVPVGQSQPLPAAPAAAMAYAEMPTMEAIEAAYAKDVELTNGRWAMLGFAALICIEAQTGLGLAGQLEMYAKAMGLLGAQSGF